MAFKIQQLIELELNKSQRQDGKNTELSQRPWTAFVVILLFAVLVLGAFIAGRFFLMTMNARELVASARTYARIGDANDVMALVEAQQAAVAAVKEKLKTPDTTKFDLEAVRIGEKTYTARGRVIMFDAAGTAATHNALVSFYRNTKDEPLQLAMLLFDEEPMFIDQVVLEKVKADTRQAAKELHDYVEKLPNE